ncbi:Isochorismatase hydrolase [Stereum hirsutum FP-91666 SS1]|uniref:Isochorismatase hydrolase n=1 Tax=Stereum hirsutum (strain FP-91666) TaxID=721885 RepID=R7RXR0_STEHR|nr:Isochorismatase hydrolase [Stereum hirsutum FP-91666 SS1]EIM80196.1 Isochorismatase hydrolase [Stereum hirsutum FP-91666 SS1]
MHMPPKIKADPYDWPMVGDILPSNTALIVIDMQNDFCSPGGYLEHQGYPLEPMRAPIPHISTLLNYFRSNRYPIFHTREGHRPDLSTLSPRELLRSRNNPSGLGIGDEGPLGRLLIRGEKGQDIIPELYPITQSSLSEGGFGPEPVLDKPGKSAFVHTELDLMLRVKGIRNLVVCGVTWEVCVGSTVREAMERGYDCLVVKDAIGYSEVTAKEGEQNRGMGGVEAVGVEGGIFGAWVAKATQVVEALEGVADETQKILL